MGYLVVGNDVVLDEEGAFGEGAEDFADFVEF